jgi:hypothetical protein
MKWRILWAPDAEQELTHIWLAAEDRNLVSRVAREIDRQIEVAPLSAGESRPDGYRIVIVAPLGVIYVAYDIVRTASVLHVWRFESPSQ